MEKTWTMMKIRKNLDVFCEQPLILVLFGDVPKYRCFSSLFSHSRWLDRNVKNRAYNNQEWKIGLS